MDDLNEKIAGILNDPNSMEQVKKMAENLFSGGDGETADNSTSLPPLENIGAIMSIVSKLNGNNDNDRTRLICALKPYLSEKKQAKADNAIKLLKIIELWPLIKDSGMFNL